MDFRSHECPTQFGHTLRVYSCTHPTRNFTTWGRKVRTAHLLPDGSSFSQHSYSLLSKYIESWGRRAALQPPPPRRRWGRRQPNSHPSRRQISCSHQSSKDVRYKHLIEIGENSRSVQYCSSSLSAQKIPRKSECCHCRDI